MNEDRSYVREIERYFLTAIGRGVMLSSKDYELIQSWKRRGVPREVLLRGIQRALDDYKRRTEGMVGGTTGGGGMERGEAKGTGAIKGGGKSLYYFSEPIENEIKSYVMRSAVSQPNAEDRGERLVEEITERLAGIIASEQNPDLRGRYSEIRDRVLEYHGLDDDIVYRRVEELQQSLYDELFESLNEAERESILEEARSMIHMGGKYMTPEAYEQSLLLYRNQVIGQRLKIKKLIAE